MSGKSRIPAIDALQEMARKVSEDTKLQIVAAPQVDSCFTVKAALIHPVQVLENSYQRAIREAARREPDAAKRRDVERAKLSEYFAFDAGEPQLINPRNPADELFEAKFQQARSALVQVRDIALSRAAESSAPIDAPTRIEVKKQIDTVINTCREIIREFESIARQYEFDWREIPILVEVADLLLRVGREIDGVDSWTGFAGVCSGDLRRALVSIGRVLEGVACVQVFHVIDTFYLYRLLVRYQVQADRPLQDDDKLAASGGLTGLLNTGNPSSNDRVWLSNWLKEKMREIDAALRKMGNLHFHLKGGRALEYVRRHPEEGRNDWDTSVLIDPDLGADQWYAKFTDVHNYLVHSLKRFKREFFIVLHKHARDFTASLEGRVETSSEGDDDALDEDLLDADSRPFDALDTQFSEGELLNQEHDSETFEGQHRAILFPTDTAACKAELIDIGIPRRDTVQAFAHWHHIGPGIIRESWTDGIPVPNHRYYIDEHLMMIRDGFDVPAKKLEKRITRLANFLDLGDEDNDPEHNVRNTTQAAREIVEKAGLGSSLQLIDRQNQPIRTLMSVILEEFVTAYDLHSRPGLKDAFDGFFSKNGADADLIARCIGDYPEAIANASAQLTEPQKVILKWVGFAHSVARRFERHLFEKAAFFGFREQWEASRSAQGGVEQSRRRMLTGLVRYLHAESAFRPEEELEVQFAITGSYAADLHADYASYKIPEDLKSQLRDELDPVDFLEIKLFCHPIRLKDAKPDLVLDAMLKPLLDQYIAQNDVPVDVQHHGDRVDVIWRDAVEIGGLTYKPLVARIRVVIEGWPQLAYVWGLPVLSLPDLVREYFSRAGQAQDHLAEKRLTRSSELLKALLTYFESGNVGDFSDGDGADAVHEILEQIKEAQLLSSIAAKSERLQKIARTFTYDDRIVSAIVKSCVELISSQAQSDVLLALLSRKDLTEAAYGAIASGSKSISSSDAKKGVLISISEKCPVTDNAASALLDAVSSITSSPTKTQILLAILRRKGLTVSIISKIGQFVTSEIPIRQEREQVLKAISEYQPVAQ